MKKKTGCDMELGIDVGNEVDDPVTIGQVVY